MNPNQPKRPASRRTQSGGRQVHVPEGYIAVGVISGAHNLRGEVRVQLYTDFPERFAPGTILQLGPDLEDVEVVTARPHKDQMLLKFPHVNDRTQAEALRGQWLFIPEDEAAELEQDTYFVHDIIGATVQTTDGRVLGVIRDVLFTGANDVYVVATPDEPPRELLLPAIAEVVKAVDIERSLVVVELMPGLDE